MRSRDLMRGKSPRFTAQSALYVILLTWHSLPLNNEAQTFAYLGPFPRWLSHQVLRGLAGSLVSWCAVRVP
jgi:hypothetical protein